MSLYCSQPTIRIMKHAYLFILVALSTILLISGCNTSTQPEEPDPIFPMYVDDNGNDINDYVEQGTHEPGPDISTATTGTPSGAPGHSFIDSDDDGICDYAQDGSPTWHGPGFIDNNDNGICDYAQDGSPSWHGPGFVDGNHNGMSDHWENGGRGHGGMMGGGHH